MKVLIVSITFSPLSVQENFSRSRAGNSKAICTIWPKIKLVEDFMLFLLTSKTEKGPIKKEGAIASTTFSPLCLWEKFSMLKGA